jgi:hypothetical protein
VFEYLELQWRRWQNPAAPAAPRRPPIIDRKLYMHNLSPADLRGGAAALDPQGEGEPGDNDDEDPSSFFHGPSRCKSALCQDHFKHDSRSLYDLLPDASSCPGIFESLLYCKDGVVSFPLHGEQLGLRFTHHQLSGDSLWIVLQAGQGGKLRELAYRMAVARARVQDESLDESKWTSGQKRAAHDVAWILLRAKALMPPLSLLNELGIRWRAEFVQAGRIMTGDGDACHMGLSISDAQTVSFATNQLDVDYLEHGPATVLRHMEWVDSLQRLHAGGKLDGWLEHLSIPGDWLRLALNYAPPPLTCALFTALRRDLPSRASQHRADYARLYTEAHLAQLHNKDGVCAQILSKLHAAKEMLEARYRDVEKDGRNLTLCSHAEAEA